MAVRILPIATPIEGQPATDNVLSEDILALLTNKATDKDTYLLDFYTDNNYCYFKCVVSRYYIEGSFLKDDPNLPEDAYLWVTRNNNLVSSCKLYDYPPPSSQTSEYLYIATKNNNVWTPIADNYRRILPRALDLSQTLVLRCGTATTVQNLS